MSRYFLIIDGFVLRDVKISICLGDVLVRNIIYGLYGSYLVILICLTFLFACIGCNMRGNLCGSCLELILLWMNRSFCSRIRFWMPNERVTIVCGDCVIEGVQNHGYRGSCRFCRVSISRLSRCWDDVRSWYLADRVILIRRGRRGTRYRGWF